MENGSITANIPPSGEVFDIGRTCLKAIVSYFTKGTKATESGDDGEYSNGNGSLMRIHPFALMTAYNIKTHYDWENIIEQASSLTHAHERSKLACKIYTLVLFRLLDAPRKDSVNLALELADRRYNESTEHDTYKRLFSPEFVKTLMNAEKQYGLTVTLYRAFGKNIRVNIGFSKSTCDLSIDELSLSVRSYNALRRANVSTLGDLIERLNEGGLKSIRNLGAKSFSEIQTKILAFGFERLSEKEKSEFFHFLLKNNTTC